MKDKESFLKKSKYKGDSMKTNVKTYSPPIMTANIVAKASPPLV